MRQVLERHWDKLNDELLGSLPTKHRRVLKRALDQVIAGLGG
jgi:hypothetical protein